VATQQQINSAGVWITDDVGLEITDGLASRVMLGLLPDGTYGLRVNSGALELFDQYGQTVMSNGAFVGPMLDFIRSGIYNNMFVAGINGLLPIGSGKNDPAGHTANLPGWTVWKSAGAGTATRIGDTTWPGGAYVQFAFSAVGATNNVGLTSDAFPVLPGQLVYDPYLPAWNVAAGSQIDVAVTVDWLLADAVTVIQTDTLAAWAKGGASTQAMLYGFAGQNNRAPKNARFGRLSLSVYEDPGFSHSAANYFNLGFVGLNLGVEVMALQEGWHDIGSTIGYQNSWANVGGAYQTGRYMKDAAGFVHLSGPITGGTIGSAAFTLPAGYRPAGRLIFAANSTGVTRIDVAANGQVIPYTGSNGYGVLDGITFLGEQ
jgi:hypothetical protein